MADQRAGRWARTVRLVAAVAVGAASGLAAAGPAAAADPAPITGAAAEKAEFLLGASGRGGRSVITGRVLSLKFANSEAVAFSISPSAPTTAGTALQSARWADSKARNLARILGTVARGHGMIGSDLLLADAQVDSATSQGIDRARRDLLSYAGTQAALWYWADSASFTLLSDYAAYAALLGGTPALNATEYAIITKIYLYLVNPATAQDRTEPPMPTGPPTVTSPAVTAGPVGGRIGPYTVDSSPFGSFVNTSDGAKIVDAAGQSSSGALPDPMYLTSDKPGTVTLTVHRQIPLGRVFKNAAGAGELIIGNSRGWEPDGVKATATFKAPAPAAGGNGGTGNPGSGTVDESLTAAGQPSPSVSTSTGTGGSASGDLPRTGASLLGAITAGVLLLAGGVAVVYLLRRRRLRFTA